MFRKLLNRSDQVKLAMIERLYEADEMFLGELALRLEQSPVLLKKYIDELNMDIDFVDITLTENNVVCLEISSYCSITNIYTFFINHALAFQILELLFYKDYPNYEALANELLVSKSTVIRLVQQINEGIEELDFLIETKPLRLEGSEKNIRQFYTIFFIEKYQGTDFPQKESLAHVMKELSFYLNRLFPLSPYFSDVQRITITMYVLSMRARMQKGDEEGAAREGGSDVVRVLGLEEFVKKESGPHIQRILEMIVSHAFMDAELRNAVGQELRSVSQNLFARFNYTPGHFQIYFSEIVFQYMLGLNLSVPYCILNDRLERYRRAKSGPFYDYLYTNLTEQVLASDLPEKGEDHIRNLYFLFLNYFPEFKVAVMRRWKPMEIALFFDTNAAHVQALKQDITELVADAADVSIVNPLEKYATTIRPQKYDLIIGNIAANASIREKGTQNYLCTDYSLSAKNRRKIVKELEEFIVEQIKQYD